MEAAIQGTAEEKRRRAVLSGSLDRARVGKGEWKNLKLQELLAKGKLRFAKDQDLKGVDVNERDEEGLTPLHLAVIWPGVKIVELLVESGAHMNAEDNDGRIPLHYAVAAGASLAKLRWLADHGADVNAVDKKGRALWEYALDDPSAKWLDRATRRYSVGARTQIATQWRQLKAVNLSKNT